MTLDGSRDGARRSVENCVAILAGTKKIDIFEYARVDRAHPIETTIGALGELVKEGKIGGIGLSAVGAETVHRAAKVHPIAMVENEVSLCSTDSLSNGVAEACAQHNIPIVAYSPLARGFLTRDFKSVANVAAGDKRHHRPRLSAGTSPRNLKLGVKIQTIAEEKSCTSAQIAIAWVRQLSEKRGMPLFIPIPGSTSLNRVKENGQIVELSKGELAELDAELAALDR
jgi:pyridoxine 4-dehydrogenase